MQYCTSSLTSVFFLKEKKNKKTKDYHFILKESLVFITKAYMSDNVFLCVNTVHYTFGFYI